MLRIFNRKLRVWQLMNQLKSDAAQYEFGDDLGVDLAPNLTSLKKRLGDSPDIVYRELTIGGTAGPINGSLIYVDGLVDKTLIDRDILRPLMARSESEPGPDGNLVGMVKKQTVTVGQAGTKTSLDELVDAVLSGDTVLLIEGQMEGLVFDTKGWDKRTIDEPSSEVVVRGPREGFIETLRTNTALLRRKIRNSDLTFEVVRIGKRTQTDVCIAYIKGLADENLIAEIKRRLQRIKTDAILESGYIEEFIEDAPFSLFPTMARSERPDAVAGKILEGRVAILVAGTPFVLTVPMFFIEAFQNPEDYYTRAYYGSLVRWIRFAAFGFSLLLPCIYVSLLTFQQELIPTPLLITMAATREGIPFPVVFEALGMGLLFEILREAGIRLPRAIGQAVSIVGALVIGQAVVSAGLVAAPMVIVVALTAISSFVIPVLSEATSYMRIILTLLAGILGTFGIIIGLLALLIHLASLRSFGVPYLAPIIPFFGSDLKDTIVRAPWWAMWLRPRDMIVNDPERQEFLLRPKSPRPKSTRDANQK